MIILHLPPSLLSKSKSTKYCNFVTQWVQFSKSGGAIFYFPGTIKAQHLHDQQLTDVFNPPSEVTMSVALDTLDLGVLKVVRPPRLAIHYFQCKTASLGDH